MTITRIVTMARTTTNVGVRGGEKCFIRASRKSPAKLSGGPGRIGRTLPANPRSIKIEPIMIVRVSSIDLFHDEVDSMIQLQHRIFESFVRNIDPEPGRGNLFTSADRASSRSVQTSPFLKRETTLHTRCRFCNQRSRMNRFCEMCEMIEGFFLFHPEQLRNLPQIEVFPFQGLSNFLPRCQHPLIGLSLKAGRLHAQYSLWGVHIVVCEPGLLESEVLPQWHLSLS